MVIEIVVVLVNVIIMAVLCGIAIQINHPRKSTDQATRTEDQPIKLKRYRADSPTHESTRIDRWSVAELVRQLMIVGSFLGSPDFLAKGKKQGRGGLGASWAPAGLQKV